MWECVLQRASAEKQRLHDRLCGRPTYTSPNWRVGSGVARGMVMRGLPSPSKGWDSGGSGNDERARGEAGYTRVFESIDAEVVV